MSEEPPLTFDPYEDAKADPDLAQHIAYAEEPFRVGKEAAHDLGETATEHMMDQLQSEAALKARNMYFGDEASKNNAAIAVDTLNNLTSLIKPEMDAAKDQASVEQDLYEDELERARKDIDFLKRFAKDILPVISDTIEYRTTEELRNGFYRSKTPIFRNIDLAMATHLNTYSIWARHAQIVRGGQPHGQENVAGAEQFDYYGTAPAFIMGSHYTENGQVDVIFASPEHNIGKANGDDNIVNQMPVMEAFVYLSRMDKSSFEQLQKELYNRSNRPMKEIEQQQVIDQQQWPIKTSKPIYTYRPKRGGESGFDKNYLINQGIDKGAIKLKLDKNKYLASRLITAEEFAKIGGLEMFEYENNVAELAEAFGKSEELKELEQKRVAAK